MKTLVAVLFFSCWFCALSAGQSPRFDDLQIGEIIKRQTGTRTQYRTEYDIETRTREVTEYVPQIRTEEYQVQVPRTVAEEIPVFECLQLVRVDCDLGTRSVDCCRSFPTRTFETRSYPTWDYERPTRTSSRDRDRRLPRIILPRVAKRVILRHFEVDRLHDERFPFGD